MSTQLKVILGATIILALGSFIFYTYVKGMAEAWKLPGNSYVADLEKIYFELRTAISNNETAQIKNLIKNGIPERIEENFLHVAAKKNDLETAKVLLQEGISVNSLSKGAKKTPLIYASEYGSIDVAKLLIQSNADLEIKSTSGYNALLTAISITPMPSDEVHSKSKFEMIKLLINSGSDPKVLMTTNSSRDSEGLAAVLASSYENEQSLEILKYLLDVLFLDVEGPDLSKQPLLAATQKGNLKIFTYLLNRNANPNGKKNKEGRLPLLEAMKQAAQFEKQKEIGTIDDKEQNIGLVMIESLLKAGARTDHVGFIEMRNTNKLEKTNAFQYSELLSIPKISEFIK